MSCLTVLDVVLDFVVDWTWFSAVGYLDVFWTIFSTKALLFLTVFAASAIMTMFAYGWANSVTPGLANAPKPVSLQARLAKLAPPTGEPRRREVG